MMTMMNMLAQLVRRPALLCGRGRCWTGPSVIGGWVWLHGRWWNEIYVVYCWPFELRTHWDQLFFTTIERLWTLWIKDTLGPAVLSTIERLWTLWIKDTLGPAVLSTIERLSSYLNVLLYSDVLLYIDCTVELLIKVPLRRGQPI